VVISKVVHTNRLLWLRVDHLH